MWFFRSPEIAFGEGALSHLEEIRGRRAFIVTDENLVALGFADLVGSHLREAGPEYEVYSQVEPEPSLERVRRGAEAMRGYEPDWVIGLGGGSCMDAAKAMWVLYERPNIEPDGINPFETLGLRQKARLITIPTTSGTGAEVNWLIVLTNPEEQRKQVVGSHENLADIAIVDPVFVKELPPRIVAGPGLDALTHAIEAYTSTWRNDYADGLCLKAIQLVFQYLARSYEVGDSEAREMMHHAATIAGLAMSNSQGALAHALGHPLGAVFHIPHGRAVGLFLPYTIEFTVRAEETRYAEIAHLLGWEATCEKEGARNLVRGIRELAKRIEEPLSIQELGIDRQKYEASLLKMIETGENDTVSSQRIPDREEMRNLFLCAYEGKEIDF